MNRPFLAMMSILGTCLFATQANAASFDCNKAGTWVEKRICSHPELSKLDEKMAKQYKRELVQATQYDDQNRYKNRVRKEQRNWLKYQRNTCKTEMCLIREYKELMSDKTYYGTVWGSTESLTSRDLPKKKAFGTFKEQVNISVYDADSKTWSKAVRNTNLISINKVANKPYLSIIDGELLFTNAHMCTISNARAMWSENHWVLSETDADKTYELRLYPATHRGKTQVLLRDIDNTYRDLYCGMRGYFDGKVLKAR